ncbi:hypothetical protein ES332_A06G103500v1 [Gossypium tomentosum]|uniref:Peptidase S54 rhomboid domain-containing protein n=1 Tax=Gossypium tomentosum TaxID=34277 RepID=A0A5D2Q1X5_GOSTO|nr:hypothetical protein ES332_A06G103500v1 [Gossypium tomentosum]
MLDLTENPKLVSLDNFKSGRLHTLITSAFIHIDIEHIVSNMIRLYFFGYNIGRIFGPEYLLRLFLAGAMGGSVFYLVHHAFLAKCRQHLELLLENIPTMFQSSTTTKSCFGAAIKVHWHLVLMIV